MKTEAAKILENIVNIRNSKGYVYDYVLSDGFMKAVNEGLETICTELKIPKITTNWARHSFATLARNNAGVAKADVDFCLGHTNNDYKMADIYIAIDYSIFDRTNRAVMNQLKKKLKKVA